LDLFKAQLARGAHDLETTGNWREIQTVDLHNVHYVTDAHDDSETNVAAIVLGVLFALTFVFIVVYVIMTRKPALKENP
jgi:hypothetical protein